MPRKIFVTGGGGFIGKRLVEKLVASKENEVTVVAMGSEPIVPGVHEVLYPTLEGIDWNKVCGQDVIVHQMANNDTRCQNHEEMWRANVYGPISLFIRAFDGGCRKFIYASSTAVYGNSPAPYTEETTVSPLNIYGKSKAAFDKFAMDFAKEKETSVVGLRYCNVYGPGEELKGKRMSMIGQLINTVLSGSAPKLFNDGTQKRDWVYIDDVVEANLLAINSSPLTKGSIYNIGSGTSISFNDLAQVIYDNYQTDKPCIEYIDCPFGEEYQNYTECNIEKARIELGFNPSFDLRSGIAAYVTYLASCSSLKCIVSK